MKSNKFATKKLSDLIRINSKIIQTLALFGRYAYFDPWTICDGSFTGYHNWICPIYFKILFMNSTRGENISYHADEKKIVMSK